jgi:PAS domain S-box-containing protein
MDKNGTILGMNRAWQAFSGTNPLAGGGVGTNFFTACETVRGLGECDTRDVVQEVREVGRGERPEFTMEYSYQSSSGQCWCELRVMPVAHQEMERLLVIQRDITRRKQAEESLHALSARLLVVQDEERRRIAKELHDSTVQELVAVMMNVDSVRERITTVAPQEARRIEDNMAILEKCAHDLRTLSYELHPPRLEEAGLMGAIRHYAEGFGERTGIGISLNLPEQPPQLDANVELVLFRVVQECLGNIHRHAHSSTASIRLRSTNDGLDVEIRDAGRGMPSSVLDVQKGSIRGFGVGISGMRERLHEIGGRLEIESGPGGTLVRAIVPADSESRLQAVGAGTFAHT